MMEEANASMPETPKGGDGANVSTEVVIIGDMWVLDGPLTEPKGC